MSHRQEMLFFSAATDYYIAGRFALRAGLGTVAGNILHHAIEMYLKGGLSKFNTAKQLRDLNHNLPAIWQAFKARSSSPDLDSFNSLISSLNAFWDVRYPDKLLKAGMIVNCDGLNITMILINSPDSGPGPRHEVSLEEVDRLVDKIFATSKVNPRSYFDDYNSTLARRHLREANAHSWAYR